MFCPKCGTKNPDDGKFCRTCGIDLGNVSAAVISGDLPATMFHLHHEAARKSNPNEVYGDAIRSIIFGIGFLIISMALLFTEVAGGRAWWWAMLFPAFTFLAKGISDYLKYGKMEKSSVNFASARGSELGGVRSDNALPPTRTSYVSNDDPRYKTGDLVPPSVTDNTTRHLEMNTEGETMTLPKK